eukprot:195867_1
MYLIDISKALTCDEHNLRQLLSLYNAQYWIKGQYIGVTIPSQDESQKLDYSLNTQFSYGKVKLIASEQCNFTKSTYIQRLSHSFDKHHEDTHFTPDTTLLDVYKQISKRTYPVEALQSPGVQVRYGMVRHGYIGYLAPVTDDNFDLIKVFGNVLS